ncbi:MAG: choice-of-anchor E domain-containing protein [Verrucomicrobiota bacterium]
MCITPSLSALAAVESFSVDYGSSASPLADGDSENLALSEFDPSLGTLTGVTITLASNDNIESEVINVHVPSASQNYSGATATLPVTLTALDGLTTTANGVDGPFSGSVSGPLGTIATAGAISTIVNTSANVAPGDFVLYEGAAQTFAVNVLVSDGIYSGFSSGDSVAFFGSGNSYGTVGVSYDYLPIPEPGTLAAGLGLLGYCGIVMSRRRCV